MLEFLQPFVQPVIAVSAALLSGTVGVVAPLLLNAVLSRTGITLAENQRQVVLGAVQTAAGILETALDKGAIRPEHIQPLSAAVREQAVAVLHAVPDASAALSMTVPDVARMIVGRTDTAAHPPPVQSQLVQGHHYP